MPNLLAIIVERWKTGFKGISALEIRDILGISHAGQQVVTIMRNLGNAQLPDEAHVSDETRRVHRSISGNNAESKGWQELERTLRRE